MFLIFECDSAVQWWPGFHRARVCGRPHYRVWRLWFAVSFFRTDYQSYRQAVQERTVGWVD